MQFSRETNHTTWYLAARLHLICFHARNWAQAGIKPSVVTELCSTLQIWNDLSQTLLGCWELCIWNHARTRMEDTLNISCDRHYISLQCSQTVVCLIAGHFSACSFLIFTISCVLTLSSYRLGTLSGSKISDTCHVMNGSWIVRTNKNHGEVKFFV